MIMKKMNPVVHFENAGKTERDGGLYTKVFGWKARMLGPKWVIMCLSPPRMLSENGRPKDQE